MAQSRGTLVTSSTQTTRPNRPNAKHNLMTYSQKSLEQGPLSIKYNLSETLREIGRGTGRCHAQIPFALTQNLNDRKRPAEVNRSITPDLYTCQRVFAAVSIRICRRCQCRAWRHSRARGRQRFETLRSTSLRSSL